MIRKICVVTGTRAEYGLLRGLIDGIQRSDALKLQLIATGMHLSPDYGLSVASIVDDGFTIDRRVEMLLASDTAIGITKSIGLGVIGFSDAYHELQPDLVLLLGDRYEIFSAAVAAMIARIPIAHLHGGEATEGLIDEAIRHSITKMSHIHFVAAEDYRRRVIQLGEQPDRVFNVGGLGVDRIACLDLMSREELEASLDFRFLERNILVTYHPVTLDDDKSGDHITELLKVLSDLPETGIILTMPNADTDGKIISQKIKEFCLKNSNAKFYSNLGQLRYFSCIKFIDGVVGNSSSGLTEVPSFKKATINIGDRQRGRLKALSVIDCEPTYQSIKSAIEKMYSHQFQLSLLSVLNPYGQGGASKKIISILEAFDFNSLIKKSFYDWKHQ